MFYQHFQCLSDPFDTFVGDKMSILVDRIFFQHFQCLSDPFDTCVLFSQLVVALAIQLECLFSVSKFCQDE